MATLLYTFSPNRNFVIPVIHIILYLCDFFHYGFILYIDTKVLSPGLYLSKRLELCKKNKVFFIHNNELRYPFKGEILEYF